jgi:hypothetical protein
MCYEIAVFGWEGNYNFYNNLMPDVTWAAAAYRLYRYNP